MHFKINKIFSYLIFILLIGSSYTAFSSSPITAGPILTRIDGLNITSSAGQINITNTSGKDIPISTMLLSFKLDQPSISGLWGAPWLNWQPYAVKTDPPYYQFVNQANLPNNRLANGSTISVQYSPQPWDNKAVPTDIQLFNVTYALTPVSVSSSVTSLGGINTITLTNTSSAPINLNGAQLKLTYLGEITSSIWGTPWMNWTVANSAPDYILNAGIATQLPVNGALTVSFSGEAKPITNISLWVQGESDNTQQGSIKINVPIAPTSEGIVNPKLTLTGPSYPKGQIYTGNWGQPLTINNLEAGSYVLSTSTIQTPGQLYNPGFSPNPVIVSGTAPINVALTYTAVKALAKLSIAMPAAPATGIPAPIIKVQGPDFPNGREFTTNWEQDLQICPNGSSSCAGISPGSYTISSAKVYSSTDAFTVDGLPSSINLTADQTLVLPVTYVPLPQGNFTVTISTSTPINKVKLQNYAVIFTNKAGYSYTKNLVAGANSVSLPVNDTYQVTAPGISGEEATVTPSSITVAQTGTPNVSIKYTLGTAKKFVVYYGGWQGGLFDLNSSLPANVTAVNLSFANITSNLQIDTATSGWLTNIPAPNVTMQPSYINWTVYKYNHPNSKVLLAIGGATFSAIWNSVLTANNADQMAQNIAKVINAPYPVYKGNISYPGNLLGNVTIDGVDLDVETGGRLNSTVSENITLLTTSLKKHLSPGKLITFAAFSVGADPLNQCTVPGSIHCGEDIPLLQSIGNLLDWVNVMAYDAGQTYATSLYQVAMANYTKLLPKSKILLGLDIQQQWPGFSETAEQLAAKALWQKQNGYGGAMFWGVGVQNNPTQELQFITAISAALK